MAKHQHNLFYDIFFLSAEGATRVGGGRKMRDRTWTRIAPGDPLGSALLTMGGCCWMLTWAPPQLPQQEHLYITLSIEMGNVEDVQCLCFLLVTELQNFL